MKTKKLLLVLFFPLIFAAIYLYNAFMLNSLNYPLIKLYRWTQIQRSTTDLQTAKYHLQNINDLTGIFYNTSFHQQIKDGRLVAIARELSNEESYATAHLEKAEKQGSSVKAEADVLCKALDRQKIVLIAIVNTAEPSLRPKLLESLKITEKDIAKAMEW